MSFEFPLLDYTPISLLFLIFLISSAFLLLYNLFFHWRLVFYKKKQSIEGKSPGISVIIAARNEEDNLYNNLHSILNQKYPEFEVIVVNHQSIDDTKHILGALQNRYKNLRVIEVERNRHLKIGKKLPITLGIKGAKFQHLIFTDADCKPTSDQWLTLISNNFSDQKSIILGYGPYRKNKGFLNSIIRFDTSLIAVNYFTFALNGLAYMGVGRNLAYNKEIFKKVGGFKSHYGISSGDDDLFIRDAANRKNVSIEISPDSFCYSEPKTTWQAWLRQKRRHYSTSGQYKVITKLLLGLLPLSVIMQLFSFVILLWVGGFLFWALLIYCTTTILRWLSQSLNFQKLNSGALSWFYPVLEPIHIIVTALMFYSRGYQKDQWN